MSNELDKYLHTVAHELRGLEPHHREAELREMRGHLEAIVARLMEGGASEAEAVEAAIAQFGAARRVGRELQHSLSTVEARFEAVVAPLAALVCHVVLFFVINTLAFLVGRASGAVPAGTSLLELAAIEFDSLLSWAALLPFAARHFWEFNDPNVSYSALMTILVLFRVTTGVLHIFVVPFVAGLLAGHIAPRTGPTTVLSTYMVLAVVFWTCIPLQSVGWFVSITMLSALLGASRSARRRQLQVASV